MTYVSEVPKSALELQIEHRAIWIENFVQFTKKNVKNLLFFKGS